MMIEEFYELSPADKPIDAIDILAQAAQDTDMASAWRSVMNIEGGDYL